MPFCCGKGSTGIYIVLGPKKSSTYSSEYASGFSGLAASHLPAAHLPRNEGLLGQTPGAEEPAPARSPWFVRQLSPGIGLAMVMLLAPFSVFAQIDPTGRSAEPPGPLKEEFVRPTPPPSPVLPIVPSPTAASHVAAQATLRGPGQWTCQ